MSRNRLQGYSKNRDEQDNESINCCQLNVHKQLIRERNISKYESTDINLFGKRSCTDVICLFVFITAVIGWIVVLIGFLSYGGPQKILAPVDSSNRRCGFDKGVEDRPNLLFFDITKCVPPRINFLQCETNQVCVSECPKSNFSASYYLNKKMPLWLIKDKLICLDEFNKNYQINSYVDVENSIRGGYCADWYMESQSSDGLCLPWHLSNPFKTDGFATVDLPEGGSAELKGVTPKLIKLGMNQAKRGEDFMRNIAEDLFKTWPWIIAFLCLAMVISFIFIVLMRWLSGIIVWATIVALVCFLSFSSFYSWKKYAETKNQEDIVINSKLVKFVAYQANLKLLEGDLPKHEYTWLAVFILSVTSLIVISIILLFLRRRILLAVQLIKEGSKAVSYAWTSLFFPLFPWALQIMVFLQAAIILCYLLGESIPIYRVKGLNGSDCNCSNYYQEGDICRPESFRNHCHNSFGDQCLTAKCAFFGKETDNFTICLHLFNLLMFLWCEYFISGFGQISLALTFATYYWTSSKRKLPLCIVASSVMKVIRYHLGTVAFGSLLLALLNWLRVMVELVYRQNSKIDNAVVRCVRCCCGCILACLHKILRLLTKNAYIMCAMKGSSYCTSAKDAFNLIIKNIIRASVLDGVTSFLFLMMKLLITASVGALAYLFFSKPIPNLASPIEEEYEYEYYFVPIIFICLGSFLVNCLFFSVYSTAVDTIFLCALEDLDVNDGSQSRPYVMSKSLIKIFKIKNRRPT